MKRTFTYILSAAAIFFAVTCNQSPTSRLLKKKPARKPVNYANYVIEIATYKTKKGVKEANFARLDSVIDLVYTRKQTGYISKESGIDQQGNWLVVVSWDTNEHANAGFDQFMHNPLSANFIKMIDTATISHKLFLIKNDESNSLKDQKPYVIELATFKEKSQVQRDTFEKRDQQVNADYISRQSGYITRRTGIAANGERLMMIYWKTLQDADAGMKEFLKDQSVADYNKMIDWKTVELKRFQAVN